MLRLCKYSPRQKLQHLLLNGGCVSLKGNEVYSFTMLRRMKKTFTFK